MPFFSIIIPVYNAFNYLDRCINSIISQSFANFELIIIDDGSMDKSLDVCKKWEAIDNRIVVFHQENKGASAARNIGIDNSKGVYIQFVDSDDELCENCLLNLYKLINFYDEPDIVEFKLNYIGPTGVRNIQGTSLKDGIYNRQYIEDVFLPAILKIKKNENICYDIFNTLRIFKRSIAKNHNILFNENIRRWEDWLFALALFNCAQSMAVTTDAIYNYYGHENGGLGGRYNPETYKYVIATYKELDELMGNKYDMFSDYAIKSKMSQLERCIREIFKYEKRKERSKLLKQIILDPYYMKLLTVSKERKGMFFLRPIIIRKCESISLIIMYLYICITDCISVCRRKLSKNIHMFLRR